MIRCVLKRLSGQQGFTLAEMVIGLAIMTAALSTIAGPLGGALRHNDDWRADLTATNTLQRAALWMGRDAFKVQTVSIEDDADPVDGITMEWTDLAGVPHTAVYTFSGTDLIRVYDGQSLVMGREVTLVEISRVGNMLTFTMTVNAGAGTTDSKTSTFLMRALQ